MTANKIVIVGYGWVGQANALALSLDGYDVGYFDIGDPGEHYAKYLSEYKKIKKLSNVIELDGPNTAYVVCVGDRVSEDGVQDISNIKKALDSIKDAKGVVVLRSTILPKYLNSLKFDFYVPEFLHEKAGVEECIRPYYMVVGRKSKTAQEPSFFQLWRERSTKFIECSPEDASHIKYLSNLWNSVRIAFTNEFGCVIEEPETPQAVARIEKIFRFIFDNKMYLRFGRSFGGHCLPKDTRAYTKAARDEEKHASLLAAILSSNNAHKLREEKYHHLPEWFSAWQEPPVSGKKALAMLFKAVSKKIKF